MIQDEEEIMRPIFLVLKGLSSAEVSGQQGNGALMGGTFFDGVETPGTFHTQGDCGANDWDTWTNTAA